MPFHYRLNDGTVVDGVSSTGWCYACNAIREIECFPDLSYDEVFLALISSGGLWREEAHGNGPRFVLHRVIGWLRRRKAFPHCLHVVDHRIIGWLQRRKAFPRCLECGSEDNVELRVKRDGEQRCVLGFRHGCGGELYLTVASIRFSWAYDQIPHRYLDEEGFLIDQDGVTSSSARR